MSRRHTVEQLEPRAMLAANALDLEIVARDQDGELFSCDSTSCPAFDLGDAEAGQFRRQSFTLVNKSDHLAQKFHIELRGALVPDVFSTPGGSCFAVSGLAAGNACAFVVDFTPNSNDPVGTQYGGDLSQVELFVSAETRGSGKPQPFELHMGMTGELVAPAEPPTGDPNDIYVWDIEVFASRVGKHFDSRIVIDVNRDSDADGTASSADASAAGVLVTVELRDVAGNLVGTYSGTTDSNGRFISEKIRGLSSGNYTAEVIDLAHETYDWNHLLDNELDEDGDSLPEDVLVA